MPIFPLATYSLATAVMRNELVTGFALPISLNTDYP